MQIVPLAQVPDAAVEALLDRAFGADRRTRTAYRIRQGTRAIPELSLAATGADGTLAGTLQCWPLELAADDGRVVPMVMVGPVAIEPAVQRGGIGRWMMRRMLDIAADGGVAGSDALMLIGDPGYYTRFFAFSDAATDGWRLPGPYEKQRLLARGAAVPDVAGVVRPRLPGAASAAIAAG